MLAMCWCFLNPNGKHTLAYVIGLWPKLESVMTIVLLSKEVSADKLLGDGLASVISNEIGRRHLLAIISQLLELRGLASGLKLVW